MIEKIYDTYHADYFPTMGYEIGIVDGDLPQALMELPDKKIQITLLGKEKKAERGYSYKNGNMRKKFHSGNRKEIPMEQKRLH